MAKRRKVGYDDETIVGGFRGDDENKFRAEYGKDYVVRLLVTPDEFRVHKVDDVRDPDEEGNKQSFNMNCSCEWDEEAADGDGDYVGDCDGCEREYDVLTRYVSGLVVLGYYKKERFKKNDPEDGPHYWDYSPSTYAKIRAATSAIKRSKNPKKRKAHQVEFVISVADARGQEYQDISIRKNEGTEVTGEDLKEFIAEWRENGPALIDGITAPTPKVEWKRRLKKKKASRRSEEDEDDDLADLDDDEEDEDETPKKKAKKKKAKKKAKKKPTRKAKKKADEEEDEDAEEDEDGDDIDDILSELDDED